MSLALAGHPAGNQTVVHQARPQSRAVRAAPSGHVDAAWGRGSGFGRGLGSSPAPRGSCDRPTHVTHTCVDTVHRRSASTPPRGGPSGRSRLRWDAWWFTAPSPTRPRRRTALHRPSFGNGVGGGAAAGQACPHSPAPDRMPTGALAATGIGSPRAACPRMKRGDPPRRFRPDSFAGDATTDPQTGLRVKPDGARKGIRTGHGCVALHRSSARLPSGNQHAQRRMASAVCASRNQRTSARRPVATGEAIHEHLDGGVESPGASHTRRSPARRDPRIGSQSCAAVPIEGYATVESCNPGSIRPIHER
jgi:hypothetical protein